MIWTFAILYALLDAFFQLSLKNDWRFGNYQVFHFFNAINRAVVAFAIGYFAVFQLITAWQDIFYIAFIILSIYWAFFDLTYNLLNGQKWYHIGSGMIDRIFEHWQIFIKIFFLFIDLLLILQYEN